MSEGGITGKGFKKGQSGNPNGRPKAVYDMQELARQHAPSAIAALVAALGNQRERVPAAIALLDRGYGRPAQAITGADGGALVTVITGVRRELEASEPTIFTTGVQRALNGATDERD